MILFLYSDLEIHNCLSYAISKQELKVKEFGHMLEVMRLHAQASLHIYAIFSTVHSLRDKSTKTDLIVTLRPGSDAQLFMSRT